MRSTNPVSNSINSPRSSSGKTSGVLSDKSNAFGFLLGALAGESRELQPAGAKWTNAGCVSEPSRRIAWRVLDAHYSGVTQRVILARNLLSTLRNRELAQAENDIAAAAGLDHRPDTNGQRASRDAQ